MGASLSSNRSSSSTRTINLISKPGCCLKTWKAKKRTILLQQLQKKKKLTTLEDYLLSSPGSKPDQFNITNGGQLYVFKNYSHNKVHPSSSSTAHHNNMALSLASKTRQSFSLDIDEHEAGPTESDILGVSNNSSSMMSTNNIQSGKLKKKVSFKLPEEADFLIIYSPEETL